MKIHPLPQHELPSLNHNDPGFVRTAGLHMSDIYGSFYQELEPKKYKGDRVPGLMEAYQGAGMALETALEQGLKDRLSIDSGRPGELEHREKGIATPILFSPDLIIFNGVSRLGEIKLTWMSSREVPREDIDSNTFPKKFDKYFSQMMAYCHCLQTPYARLYGFFVNGTWDRKRMQPEFLGWDIEFSPREIRDEWSMLINHARSVRLL